MEDEAIFGVEKNTTPKKSLVGEFFKEVKEVAFIVIFILIPIRIFIAQPFIVVGSSMQPTFQNGDYLIVDEISYRFEKPSRGDVVVFKPPTAPNEHYIKRVIGLPGETVSVNGNKVFITNEKYPDGFMLEEDYVHSLRDTRVTVSLGEDEYFVMGDNREASSDSRIWGPLSLDKITGRAVFRLFPLAEAGTFPGKAEFNK